MFVIERTTTVEERRYYSLTVNDSYIQYLNRTVTNELVNPDVFTPLTEADVRNIMEDNENAPTTEYEFKSWNDRTYTSPIDEWIRDTINEDIWEYFTDSDVIDEYDVEDEIYDK